MSKTVLDYERLEVYQLARELARACAALIHALPGGRADLVDQLRRTCLSVPLNIAEGAGEFAPKEKARFYRMARRSCTETGAILDHMTDLRLISGTQAEAPKVLVRRITGALVRLIQSTERTTAPTETPSPAP